ncbi:MAG: TolC family protein [Yoonia sp.]
MTLAACGSQPADMAQMSVTMTESLLQTRQAEQVVDLVQVDIIVGFAPAIRQAVEANERYLAALYMEKEMMARIGVAESARRPQITGNSTVGLIREQGGTQPDEDTAGAALGINISQLIYDGGESAANINRATAEALGARAERNVQGNELALEAARAWIDVWQYDERLRLLRDRTSEMTTVLSQIERMASNGMIDRAALDSALRQVIDIELQETRLKAEQQQAEVRFERLFNQQPKDLPRPAEIVSLVDARAQAAYWQQAPVLQRSAAELIVARSTLSGARAAFKPRARVQAGVTSPMQRGESTDTNIGIFLEYTFGDGGRRVAQLDAAEARVEVVEVGLSDAQRSLASGLDAALQQLGAIERSMPLVARQIELSASEAEISQSQLATGQSDLRQLIGAKIENYRAEDLKISMRAEKMVLQLTISSRTGALTQLIGLNSASAD